MPTGCRIPRSASPTGTRATLDPSGPCAATQHDAAEVRAVADDHQAAQAIGFSRGARAIVGALAEGPTLFERIALVIPPGGRAAGRYSSWLDSLPKRGEANSPQKSSLSVTTAIKGIWSEWHKRGPSSWAPIWRYCRRGQSKRPRARMSLLAVFLC